MAEPVGGRLSAAMRATYQEAGVSQADIAEALETDQPTVSRWARGMRRPPLDALPVVERLCNVPVGTILRRAGYVEDAIDLSVESAVRADPRLDATGRMVVMETYNHQVGRTVERSRSAIPAI